MNMLSRRVARLEAAITPKPQKDVVVLVEPAPDAHDVEWEKHRTELDHAKRDGRDVHLVSSVDPLPDGSVSVKVFGTVWEAHFAAMARKPSTRGNRNALEDLLQATNGNVVGIVDDPRSNDELEFNPAL